MIALIQRVSGARVSVSGQNIGEIGPGLLVMIGVVPADDSTTALRLLERILDYRVFPDADGRMNLSLRQHGGGLLLVPQFTLAADTRRGNRPGFATAAPPAQAKVLFEALLAAAVASWLPVASGQFGADMQVSLTNDGPVTLWVESGPPVGL